MEERVPPPTTRDDADDLSPSRLGRPPRASTKNATTKNDSLSSGSQMAAPQIIPPLTPPPGKELETYVVRIPKDQIYRVPPPENALIMERRRTTKQKKSIWATKRCQWFISLLIIALILGLVAGGIYFFMFFPQTPKFSVSKVVVKIPNVSAQKGVTPNYDISIKVKNMNERTSVDYDSDDASSSSSKLSFKGEDIAFGGFPAFHEESKEEKEVSVKLAGVKKALPQDIEKRLHGKNSTPSPILLDLKMHVAVKASVWQIKVLSTKLLVSCKLMVGTLNETARVLFQECETDSSQ